MSPQQPRSGLPSPGSIPPDGRMSHAAQSLGWAVDTPSPTHPTALRREAMRAGASPLFRHADLERADGASAMARDLLIPGW